MNSQLPVNFSRRRFSSRLVTPVYEDTLLQLLLLTVNCHTET